MAAHHLKPELVERDKMAAETPSKLSGFMYSELFGDSPVPFVNRYSRTARSGVMWANSPRRRALGRPLNLILAQPIKPPALPEVF